MDDRELIIRAQEIKHKPFHLSDSLRIIYVFKGSVTLGFTAGQAVIEEGQAEIINIAEPVEFVDGTPGNVSLIFEIDGQLARRKQPQIDKALYNCSTTLFYPCMAGSNHRQQLKSKLMLLYGLYTRTDDKALIDKVIGEIEDLIVEKFHDFKNMLVAAGVSENNMARLLRIYDAIYCNASRKLNLKEIAEREFVSVQYLSREFNEKLHTNFKATVEYYKVIQAVRYLISTDMSITTVSENSGFSAPRFFYKQFAFWLKCTPSEFRARIAADEEKVIEFPPDDELVSKLIARIETTVIEKEPPAEDDGEQTPEHGADAAARSRGGDDLVSGMMEVRELLEEVCRIKGKQPDARLVFLSPEETQEIRKLTGLAEIKPLSLVISTRALHRSPAGLTYNIQETMSYVRLLRSMAAEKGINTAFYWELSADSVKIDTILRYEPTDVILGLLSFAIAGKR